MTVCSRFFSATGLGAPLTVLAVAAMLSLSGCGEKENPLQGEHSVAQLWKAGLDELNDENYGTAAKIFDAVEQQHPYSVWATRAQLMAAYADYEGLRYDDAIDALTRFIELHPGNPHVDYAYYMRAICYYEQLADIRRDQRASQQAFVGFFVVFCCFFVFVFVCDASIKLDLTRDHLAAKEMDIGRYYEREGNYIAAVNRFKTVVDRFQTSSHVPEALERLVESYLELGLKDEAQKSAAVLGFNYPNSDYYKQAYGLMTPGAEIAHPEDKGVITRVWESLF